MEIQWSLVLFTAISGAGAWCFACLGINEFVRKATNPKSLMVGCVVSAVLLAVGGLLSMTHLSHIEHVLWVLQHPAPGIFVEALLIGIDAILAIVYFLLVRREVKGAARKVIAVLAIAMGPIFTYSCGSSYMMTSQLSWDTYALPLGYMGTAIPFGASAWLLLLQAFKESDDAKQFAGWELCAGGAISLVLGMAYGVLSDAAIGDQALLFWIGIVLLGSLVPMACGYLATRKPGNVMAVGVAGALGGLVGSISYRVLMWTVSVALMSLFGITIGE